MSQSNACMSTIVNELNNSRMKSVSFLACNIQTLSHCMGAAHATAANSSLSMNLSPMELWLIISMETALNLVHSLGLPE